MQKICFIVNPISGKGNNILSSDHINSFFNKDEFEVAIHYSAYPKHAIELTNKALENQSDIIVACGGDGTINEVASMLVNSQIKLGIIPIGSGNGLASNLKISYNLNTALEVIKKGATTCIDVGKINEYFFFSNTGLGIDAEIIKKYQQSGRRTLVSYLKSSIKASFTYKPKLLSYTIENCKYKSKPLLLFVSNSNEMGYKMSLTPKASLSDGFLDLVIVPKINLLKQSVFGVQVLTKRIHKNKNITKRLIKELNVYLEKKQECLIQIDGEPLCLNAEHIQIQILEKSLTIII